jgi:hypothetical protein
MFYCVATEARKRQLDAMRTPPINDRYGQSSPTPYGAGDRLPDRYRPDLGRYSDSPRYARNGREYSSDEQSVYNRYGSPMPYPSDISERGGRFDRYRAPPQRFGDAAEQSQQQQQHFVGAPRYQGQRRDFRDDSRGAPPPHQLHHQHHHSPHHHLAPHQQPAASTPTQLPTEPPYTAFIRNLSFNVTEDDIAKFFSDHCRIISVSLQLDNVHNRPKGFGWIEFQDVESLVAALSADGAVCTACCMLPPPPPQY